MTRPTSLRAIVACAMSAIAIGTAAAQDWQPSRPVTLVVPFPAGGGNDALARLVAERMSKPLGQQVVVENRGGAGGTVATRAIAKSPPDGHTILLSYTGTFAINPTLYPNAGYDPRKDFAPIGTIGTLTSILVAHPSLPVKSTADLITYAKTNPGKINYGFVPGTVGHISTEMVARSASIKLTNIPYKGNGNAIADLMGGHVSMMFLSILPVIGQIQAGTLRALAVASPARSALVPDVPTIAESGLPGYECSLWQAIVAPTGTPAAIIARLNREANAILNDPDVRAAFTKQGVEPEPGTAEALGARIRDDVKKWREVIISAGIKEN